MRQEKDFMGLPVRSLQLMLGSLAQGRPGLAQLVPDGIFGEATLEAVMRFQREHGLAVTGRVDLETWEAIAAAYAAAGNVKFENMHYRRDIGARALDAPGMEG